MVAQIVISKLRQSQSREEFLELTRQMLEWFQTQPGFLGYELYESETGWADKILWQSQEHAKAGNQAFAETEIAKGFSRIVDPDYRGFIGSPVLLG